MVPENIVMVLVAAVFIGLFSDNTFPEYGISHYCSQLEQGLDDMFPSRDVFHRKGIVFESFVAFICWSTTYLFVRRYLNPDTRQTAMRKFSPDAFYGGLAAAAAVVLKSYLISNVNHKKTS